MLIGVSINMPCPVRGSRTFWRNYPPSHYLKPCRATSLCIMEVLSFLTIEYLRIGDELGSNFVKASSFPSCHRIDIN